jgi:hypothetical protein
MDESVAGIDRRIWPLQEMPNFQTETRCENELVEESV